jgi:hypothetical protein
MASTGQHCSSLCGITCQLRRSPAKGAAMCIQYLACQRLAVTGAGVPLLPASAITRHAAHCVCE